MWAGESVSGSLDEWLVETTALESVPPWAQQKARATALRMAWTTEFRRARGWAPWMGWALEQKLESQKVQRSVSPKERASEFQTARAWDGAWDGAKVQESATLLAPQMVRRSGAALAVVSGLASRW
jgi:hypothetical protein